MASHKEVITGDIPTTIITMMMTMNTIISIVMMTLIHTPHGTTVMRDRIPHIAIVIIIPTENTTSSAISIPFPPTRTTIIIKIYTAIITGASPHLNAHGNTTISLMAALIRMDKITGLMTGEIKSKKNSGTTMKRITASVMKIMDRPRIKEKAAAGIIINDLTVTRDIQKNE
jgi:hypothetical protein